MVKSALGAGLCLGVVLFLEPSPYLVWPLTGLSALFGLYLLSQATRLRLRIGVDPAELRVTGVRGARRLAWDQLTGFSLSYYPFGRKAKSGTLVLVVKGPGLKLKADSHLDQFAGLLQKAAEAALARDFFIDPATQSNLEKLGLAPEPVAPPAPGE